MFSYLAHRQRKAERARAFYDRCVNYAMTHVPHVLGSGVWVWPIGQAELRREWFGRDSKQDRFHYTLTFGDGRSIKAEHTVTGDIRWQRGTNPDEHDLAEARLIL